MYSLNEFKKRLDNIYDNLDNIEEFGINTKTFKRQIEEFDEYCDKYDTNSNASVQVQYSKKDEKGLKSLDMGIKLLEQNIININYALGLIKTMESINISKDTTKEELNDIVAKIMDQLHMFYKYKDILNIKLLDSIYEKIYQIIKYEFKYNGKSTILDFLEPNKLLTERFFEIWTEEYHKYMNLFKGDELTYEYSVSSNYLSNIIFRIAINEDNFLSDVEDELDNSISSYTTQLKNLEDSNELLNSQKEANKERRKEFRKLNSIFIPFFVSMSILIGANTATVKSVKDSREYKTTKSTYLTVSEEVITEETYSKSSVGDVKITLYYPTDEKGARIIKEYELNDEGFNVENYENVDLDSLDFASSKYEVDKDSNKVSTDKYAVVEKVTSINVDEKNNNPWVYILYCLLVSGMTLMGDIILNYLSGENYFFLSEVIYTRRILRHHKEMLQDKNRKYPKQNTKETKELLHQIKKEILQNKKDYEKLYSSYSYLDKYLDEDGYQRKLK